MFAELGHDYGTRTSPYLLDQFEMLMDVVESESLKLWLLR